MLTHVAAGLSNDEIVERLVISGATAKTHVSRIVLKLNARDRIQLVVIAYESGLVKARATPAPSPTAHAGHPAARTPGGIVLRIARARTARACAAKRFRSRT